MKESTYNTVLAGMLITLGVLLATLFVVVKNSYDFHQKCDGVVVTKSYQGKHYCIPTDILKGK